MYVDSLHEHATYNQSTHKQHAGYICNIFLRALKTVRLLT